MAATSPLLAAVLWLCIIAFVGASGYPSWTEWKAIHNKHYSTEREEDKRRSIWARNLELVVAANSERGREFVTEMNSFADRRASEMTGPIKMNRASFGKLALADDGGLAASDVPTSFSWVSKGVVTPVQNQGQLGDVAAIVTAECVESFHAIQTGNLVSLSAMEVHDCCPFPSTDFNCVQKIGGLCRSSDYPSTTNPSICKNDSCLAAAQVNGGVQVQAGNETALLLALLKTPVAVGVDASQSSFQLYRSGVYSDPKCSGEQIDHFLQLVGYGILSDGTGYWICRNSWGASWGMRGYIWIARNKQNMCGIASYASYPV